MSKLNKNFIALFSIFLICAPAFAMGSFTDNDIIWQADTNEIIKYIEQDTSSLGKNDHPVVIQANEINTILASLKFQEQENESLASGKESKSVFTAQQADLLGRYLEQGLKDAKPHQDIIFAMEKSVNRLSLLKPARYFVAGRVFYKDNQLNIIIGDYDRLRNEAIEAVNDPTGTGHIQYSFDHGKRSNPSSFNKTLFTIEGIENKRLNNIRRADWLVMDVNVASQAVEHMTSMRKQDEMANKRKELMEVLGSEAATPVDATNKLEKVSPSVEERLTELKHLRHKELITEEEYAQKRKQILDDL